MKKTILTLVIFALTLTITSCKEAKKEEVKATPKTEMTKKEHQHDDKNSHDHNAHNHNTKMDEKREISTTKQKNSATTPIVDAYLEIKNGLVADSKSATAKGGTAMVVAFSKFDMSKLSGNMHKEYMEIMESAKEHAEHIVKSDIAHQREHFEVLSTDISDLVTLLGTEKTLFKDFCPMANRKKGAYWLSEIKEIKNPYFGAKMMKCGSIKEQIN